ncbi:MAG: filamentous hemagglutinin N-terminal domain-containing protein, partial [Bacillota bacterium]
MKQSRKIRRSWLRNIPEWMRCFARSVTRAVARVAKVAEVARAVAVAGVARVVGAAGEKCQNFARSLNSGLRTLDSGLKAHTKEWAAVALAAGLIAAPYSVDLPSATLNSGLRTQNCLAAPADGTVVGGAATIQQQTDVTTISQTTARAAIDWTSFDIAKNETVNFLQPNADAAMLNRVIGATSSQIFGNLNANGHIYIVNPNGINVGNTANINANGVYLSTANVDPASFMSSQIPNPQSLIPGSGNIVVAGNINAGSVVVLENAKTAAVSGTIIVPGGNVTINKIDNININGTIDVSASPTQDSGLRTLNSNNGGRIIIVADNTADVSGARLFARGSSATLNSGLRTQNSSDGGFIETSGKNVLFGGATINAGATNGVAGSWLIDPADITIDSTSAAAISLALTSNAVTVATSDLVSGGNGDILVNSTIDYSAGTNNNSLLLSAYRNITILSGQQIKFGGTGTLTLRTDKTGTGTGTLNATSASAVTLGASAVAKVYYNNATYTAPTAFNISGGTSIGYMLINSTADFTRLYTGGTALLGYNFALGKSIDAVGLAATSIGTDANPFTGKFDGLNNTLSNLTINQTAQFVGLFGCVSGSGATISNLNLYNAHITGYQASDHVYVGGVAGYNNGGTISGITVSGGTISGSSTSGYVYVGGVAGNNNGTISGVTVSGGTISGSGVSGAYVFVGGVAGVNNGSISGVTVSGGTISVSSVSGTYVSVGGVAGYNYSGKTISGALVSGATINGSNVSTGDVYVGGVAGGNNGTISGSTITGGTIGGSGSSGAVDVGGVAGYNSGTISSVTVSGGTISGSGSGDVLVGGVAGYNSGTSVLISNDTVSGVTLSGSAVSTGRVFIGGAVGQNFATITTVTVTSATISGSGASGWVTVGGAAGYNSGIISGTTVSGGTINGSSTSGAVDVGGMTGYNNTGATISGGTVNGATISGSNVSTGDVNVGGVAGGNNGTISGSTVTGGKISANSTSGVAYVGGVAGQQVSGTINSVTITGATISGSSTSGTVDVGGVAGANTGTISGVAVSVVTMTGSNVSGGINIGGAVGNHSSGLLTATTVSGSAISAHSNSGTAYVGGINGYGGAAISNDTVSNTSLAGASNSGSVGVGDIHGYVQASNNLYVTLTSGGAGMLSYDNFLTTATVALTGTTASVTQLTGAALTLGASTLAALGVAATGSVSQVSGSALTVSGLSTLTAGTNIDLYTNAGANAFGNTVTYGFSGAIAHNALLKNTTSGIGFAISTLDGGNLSNLTLAFNAATAITLGGTNMTSMTTLNVTGGTITESAALTAGTATINAGTSAITLNSANKFGTLSLTGGTAQISESDAIALGATSLTTLGLTATGGIVSQSGILTIGTATINAGSYAVNLNTSVNKFGTLSLTGGNAQISESDAIALGASSLTTLGLTATGGAVSQSGILAIGTATINAGTNAITLTTAGNAINTLGMTGSTATVSDAAVTLAASALTTLTLTDSGSVTQSGLLNFTSAATISTSGTGASIDLSTFANVFNGGATYNFSGTGSHDAKMRNQSSATLAIATLSGSLGNLTINQPNSSVTLGGTDMTSMATLNVTSGAGISQTEALTVSGTSTLNATGSIDLSTYDNAFGGAVTYSYSAGGAHNALLKNTVSGVGLVISTLGTISGSNLSNLTLQLNSATAVTLGGANMSVITGNLSVTGGAVVFGATTISGDTTIVANGTVTQTGAITANVSGKTFSITGCLTGSDIVLNNPNNDFNIFGVSFSTTYYPPFNATVVDKNNLTLGAINLESTIQLPTTLTVTAGASGSGSITQIGGLNIGTGVFTAATDIDLSNNANDTDHPVTYNFSAAGAHNAAYNGWGTTVSSPTFGTVSGSLQNVSLYAEYPSGTMELANITAATLTVTASGAVIQSAGTAVVLSGATNVLARSGLGTTADKYTFYGINLGNSGNNFSSFSATGDAITVADSNAIVLGNITNYFNSTLTVASLGTLCVTAGGNITQTSGTALNLGKSDFSPTFTFAAPGHDVILTNTGVSLTSTNTFTGKLAVTGANINITHTPRTSQQFGESLGLGDTEVTGNYTLKYDCTGNAKSIEQQGAMSVGGTLGFSAPGDITLTGNNTLNIVSLTSGTATVHNGGNMTLGNVLSANTLNIVSSNGGISQLADTSIVMTTLGTLTATALTDITLGNTGNTLGTAKLTGVNATLKVVTASGSAMNLQTDLSGNLTTYIDNVQNIWVQPFTSEYAIAVDGAASFNPYGSADNYTSYELWYVLASQSTVNVGTHANLIYSDPGVTANDVAVPVLLHDGAAAVDFTYLSMNLPLYEGNYTYGNITMTRNSPNNPMTNLSFNMPLATITQAPGATWNVEYVYLTPDPDSSMAITGQFGSVKATSIHDLSITDTGDTSHYASYGYINITGNYSGSLDVTSANSSITGNGSNSNEIINMTGGSGHSATFTTGKTGGMIWLCNSNDVTADVNNFGLTPVTYTFTSDGSHDVGYTNVTTEDAAAPTLTFSGGSLGQLRINMPNSTGAYQIGNVNGTSISLNLSNKNIVQATLASITSNSITITGKNIDLTNSGNVFSGGAMTLSGNAISVKATTGDITLGTINASGALTVDAVSGSILGMNGGIITMLSNSAISMTASGNITMGSYNSLLGTGTALAVFTGSSAHDFYYGSSSLDAPLPSYTVDPLVKLHNLRFALTGASNHPSNYTLGNYEVTGSFELYAPFDIAQSAGTAIIVGGNVAFGSNWGSIVLSETGNSLATDSLAYVDLSARKNVTLTGYTGNMKLGQVETGYSSGGEVISGNLILQTTGNITKANTQNKVQVVGSSSIAATGDIVFEYDFSHTAEHVQDFGVVSVTGANVDIWSTKNITLGTSTITGALTMKAGYSDATGDISQTGVLTKNNSSAATITSIVSNSTINLGDTGNNLGSGTVTFNQGVDGSNPSWATIIT